MPIIFENRLGNSASDKKLRKIYHLHYTLWTLYYAILIAVFGFGLAILVDIKGNLILAFLIAAITVGLLGVFLKKQLHRRRRK